MTPEKIKEFEDNLWQTADTLRANSDLKSSEYATPVLGMIFLGCNTKKLHDLNKRQDSPFKNG